MKNIFWEIFNNYLVPTGLMKYVAIYFYKYRVPNGTYKRAEVNSVNIMPLKRFAKLTEVNFVQ
jgi:hypothetical protein